MMETKIKLEYPEKYSTENIYTVTEAFSTQPITWFVGKKQNVVSVEWMCETISNIIIPFYVGFNKYGKPVFKIRVDCSTITYKQ